jgi:phosphatidylserine/phosphatidylglycerophosphate/cardiolipin synthase-like enzyme
MALSDFQVTGNNAAAPFTLKLHRGDGMTLLAMNWTNGLPPKEFVGFAMEYKEPQGDRFYSLKNRLGFPGPNNSVDPTRLSTLRSPIQKFRWIHFPRNAELLGKFTYKVTPVFMNDLDELSFGEAQQAEIELRRETYPRKLNVTFTRGFVSSQSFVDKYASNGNKLSDLIPPKADDGLTFQPTHPKTAEALAWMGFEARHAILQVLDKAVADPQAQVRVVAYDLCEPDIVSRLAQLGNRLKIIIDDSASHGELHSAESQATATLIGSAGANNVKRQHMGRLQHNKTIVVDGPEVKRVICGSTNFTWRGLFVQSNNAMILSGKKPVKAFADAFDHYWQHDSVAGFSQTPSAAWIDLGLTGIDAKVTFSPHSNANAQLAMIANDIDQNTSSSLFYSLAFLYQTPGPIQDAIIKVTQDPNRFVYGISDRKVGGLDVQLPDGKIAPARPSALTKNIPEPFKSEPTGLAGGVGNRMHHKFVVIDFDKPTARVYLGSYNFSSPADIKNGENLLLIKDRRIAVSYTIEALRLFDHYHFRVLQEEAAHTAQKKLFLKKPPRNAGEVAWWKKDFTDQRRIKDRLLFA